METIFLFCTAQIETGVAGAYAFTAKKTPDGPVIRESIGKIPPEFYSGVNLSAFYCINAGIVRTSARIKAALNGIPFRLVVVDRNANAITMAKRSGEVYLSTRLQGRPSLERF